MLSPRLQLRVSQKQILTPGVVQMVTVLQLNRLELKEMLTQEMVKNPVLEESGEAGDEVTPEELLPLLEPERVSDPADREILDSTVLNASSALDGSLAEVAINGSVFADAEESAASAVTEPDATVAPDPLLESQETKDPFDEI